MTRVVSLAELSDWPAKLRRKLQNVPCSALRVYQHRSRDELDKTTDSYAVTTVP